MIAALALAVVVARTAVGRARRPVYATAAWWPWLIGVVERRGGGRADDLPTATVGVCLHGPPPLRRAAREVVRARPGADPLSLLAALRDDVASARGDRLFGTVAAVVARAADAGPHLARLRAVESAVSADEEASAAVASTGSVARWLLLAPLVPVAAGRLAGPAAWLVAAAALGAWWLADRWLRTPPRMRVFADEPIGTRR